MAERTAAFLAGMRAYETNRSHRRAENPHRPCEDDYLDWEMGYEYAQEDAENDLSGDWHGRNE